MNEPQVHWLPDGRRLHMNHGPIDLIVEAWGEPSEVDAAYGQATTRFESILRELVSELPVLRMLAERAPAPVRTPTAMRMARAVSRLAHVAFITPMAAVAGAVADEILAAMIAGRTLRKAYVNNGGDVALHLASGEALRLAVAGTGPAAEGSLSIVHGSPVRGIATSGWRGRSFSLGIADAVTILARDAASADAAATLVANAVDLPGHPAVVRMEARRLQPDTDLGHRLVTTDVGALQPDEVQRALAGGAAVAQGLLRDGWIEAAALFLAGDAVVIDPRKAARVLHEATGAGDDNNNSE